MILDQNRNLYIIVVVIVIILLSTAVKYKLHASLSAITHHIIFNLFIALSALPRSSGV